MSHKTLGDLPPPRFSASPFATFPYEHSTSTTLNKLRFYGGSLLTLSKAISSLVHLKNFHSSSNIG